MITAIIIDDEPKGRQALRQKLEAYCTDVRVVGEANDGLKGIHLIEALKPGLVFLDIEMPKMNGFEMLNAIKTKDFRIIFTTAYDQYAIKAIKYAAFDYLLKPIDITELKQTVLALATSIEGNTKSQIDLLNENLNNPQKILNKLAIPTLDGLFFYNINDIVRLEANSNYTNICFVNNSKIVASKTLKDFEELLPDDIFFRTHHSHIINMNFLKRYIKGDGGQIELQNGDYVEVSRRKKEEFLGRIIRS